MKSIKLGIAAALALLASFTAASAQQVLKVAADATPSALGGYDPASKTFDGMAVEFITLVANNGGLKIEFVAVPAGEQLAALADKKVDIVAGARTGTVPEEALTKSGQPSYAYATYRDVLILKDGTKKAVRTSADLKGMSVGILKGPEFTAGLAKLGAKTKAYDTPGDLMAAVEKGDVEGAILYSHFAKDALKDRAHPTLSLADLYDAPLHNVNMLFVVQKGNGALITLLNDEMQKLLFNQTGSKVAFRWGVIAEKSFLSEPCICAGP